MISFIVNDREVRTEMSPATPLVDFIRLNQRLLGTKIGCREGDCGACTVVIGDLYQNKLSYRTVTSCLMPIANVQGKHVVTIEGVNPVIGLNPMQKRFLENGGTQCGFCTPGFLMGITGFALSSMEVSDYNALASVDGNICRCTGYKSITTAIEQIVQDLKKRDSKNPVKWLVKENYIPEYFLTIEERLRQIQLQKAQVNQAGVMVGGGTDLYVEEFEHITTSDQIIPLAEREDLRGIKLENSCLHIGASTRVEEMRHSDLVKKLFPDLERQSRLISSTHIRHMATVAGNIVNGAPIGDLTVSFMACNAKLIIANGANKREVELKDFYKGYKKADLNNGDVVEAVIIPLPDAHTKFNFEKVSKRTYLDIAVVNSALRLQIEKGVITAASYAVGGVGPTVLFMRKTCDYLLGKKIDNFTFKQANDIAQSEISPRSRAEYKRLLVKTQLFNHLSNACPDAITLEALV